MICDGLLSALEAATRGIDLESPIHDMVGKHGLSTQPIEI